MAKKKRQSEESLDAIPEKTKKPNIEEFIKARPELQRYTTYVAFKSFLARNKEKYNNLLTIEDLQGAYNGYFGIE